MSPLTESDLGACAELYVTTFNAPPWSENWGVGDATRRLAEILGTPGALGVCLREPGGELAGFAAGHLERHIGEDHFLLQEMCVRTARQRQGHGAALLAALADRIPEVRQWYLLTARDSAASAFYERNGFRPAGRMGVFIRRTGSGPSSRPGR